MPRIPRSEITVGLPTAPSVSAGVSGSAAAGPGLALAELAQGISDSSIAELQRLKEARQATALGRANLRASERLSELEEAYAIDPDYETAPERFAADVTAVRKEILEGLEDRSVQAQFAFDFDKLALAKSTNVRSAARKSEVDQHQAELDSILPTYARLAGAASSDVEQDALIDQALVTIQNAVAAGTITATEGVARAQDLRSTVEEAGIRALIAESPKQAVDLLLDPENLPSMDPVARTRLLDTAIRREDAASARRARDLDRADRRADEERRERADVAMKEIFARHGRDELDAEFVEDQREDLSSSQYRTALDLLDPDAGEVSDDLDTLLEVNTTFADNAQEGLRMARQAFSAGLLSAGTYKSFETQAAGEERRDLAAASQYIERNLSGGDLMADPAQRARAAQAVDDFRTWFFAAERSAPEIRAEQQSIVRRFQLFDTGEALIVPPQPRSGEIDYLGDDFLAIEQQLAAAEVRAVEQLERGAIDESTFQIETDLLARGRSWLRQRRAAAQARADQARGER